jgi:hypothetical protein
LRKKDLKYAILAAGLLSVSAIGGICKVNANGKHGYTGYEAQPGYTGNEAQVGYSGWELHFADHAQPGYTAYEPADRETLIQRIIDGLRNLGTNQLIGLDMFINGKS